jgi:Tol biopolymer transport system component/C-terminal processing protease CtpA/Prc
MTQQQDQSNGRPFFRMPTLSPDGQHLAFVHANDIWCIPIEGGIAERLTAHGAGHTYPTFSPDGSSIAFSSGRVGAGDIYVLPLEGGDVRRLTYDEDFCSVDDWSPDGSHLYYTSCRGLKEEGVYRVSLQGETPLLVYAEPYEDIEHTHCSPDGKQIAFNVTRRPWWRAGYSPFSPTDIFTLSLTEQEQPAEPPSSTTLPFLHGLRLPNPTYITEGRWPLWAQDDSGLYFVSAKDGIENIWFQPLTGEGGDMRRVTSFEEGRVMWPTIARNHPVIVFERDWQLWMLDLASGETSHILIRVRGDTKITPVQSVEWRRAFGGLAVSPDAKKLAFTAYGQIFVDFADKSTDSELREGPAFRVTETSGREWQISWAPDSNKMVYVSDRHGENELYLCDFLKVNEIRLTDSPKSKWAPVFSPDGKWIAFFRGFDEICLLDVETKEVRTITEGYFSPFTNIAWSPDSKWIAYAAGDQSFFSNVYVHHIDETESHQITFLANLRGDDVLWAPNGKFIVFTTGHYRTESQVARVDLCPPSPYLREEEFGKLFKEEKKDEEAKKDEEKPEEKKEEKQEEKQDGEELDAANAAEESSDESSDEPSDESSDEPEQKEEDQKEEKEEKKDDDKDDDKKVEPVKIVFEGIERRISFLTPIQMDASVCSISENSRDLLFLATVTDKENIWTIPLDEPRRDSPPQQITSDSTNKSSIQFASNSKFYYVGDGMILSRKLSGDDRSIIFTSAKLVVDFEKEKQQVFNEAWRMLRDTFYDATFGGRDWEAIREWIVPQVAGARTRTEFCHILNLMLGELNTSHLGAYWLGGSKDEDGYTGLVFDASEQARSGYLRIAAIIPYSPAAMVDEPPKVGEYLVAVDLTSAKPETPIEPTTNLDQLLSHTVGRRVVLKLADSPTSEEKREIVIRPIDQDDYQELCYQAWVEQNKRFVAQVSDNRLGYIHIRSMDYEAYQEFLINLDAQTMQKEGVVIDIRYNGGGHIATFILDVLSRRSVLMSSLRDRQSSNVYHYGGNRALPKPTVLVTNESSASNAEMFAESYRRLGLGKVIGKPTAGAVIGTMMWPLLNGLGFRLPLFSISTPEGENLEGRGRAVDVEVAHVFGDWRRGWDHQLEAAVTTLLESADGTY